MGKLVMVSYATSSKYKGTIPERSRARFYVIRPVFLLDRPKYPSDDRIKEVARSIFPWFTKLEVIERLESLGGIIVRIGTGTDEELRLQFAAALTEETDFPLE